MNPLQLVPGVPFSLACCMCDCDSPDTLEEAMAAGWTDIQFDPQGLSWNYLGSCPDHSVEPDSVSRSLPLESATPPEIPPWEPLGQ
jgi:hypothetical protein